MKEEKKNITGSSLFQGKPDTGTITTAEPIEKGTKVFGIFLPS